MIIRSFAKKGEISGDQDSREGVEPTELKEKLQILLKVTFRELWNSKLSGFFYELKCGKVRKAGFERTRHLLLKLCLTPHTENSHFVT